VVITTNQTILSLQLFYKETYFFFY